MFIEVELLFYKQNLLVEQLAQHKYRLPGLLLLLFHQLNLFFAERLVGREEFFVLTSVEPESSV